MAQKSLHVSVPLRGKKSETILACFMLVAPLAVSVPLRGKKSETRSCSTRHHRQTVSVPLRGKKSETLLETVGLILIAYKFPSPCGVKNLKSSMATRSTRSLSFRPLAG